MNYSIRGASPLTTLMLLALTMTLTGGCVTKGKYNDLAAQKSELEQRNAELAARADAGEAEVAELRDARNRLSNALQEEVASGQVRIRRIVDGVQLDVSNELLFPSGSAKLSTGGREVLDRIAKQLKGGQEIISVVGHTDNLMIGPSLLSRYPSNWELAAARASRVVRRLSAEGVAPPRLRAISRGPFAPIASNDTEAGRAKNRRTEIILRSLPATE